MEVPEKIFNNWEKDITFVILKETPICQILDQGIDVSFESSIGDLRLVCRGWQNIIDNEIDPKKSDNTWKQKKQEFFINAVISAYDTKGYGADCKAFLNGKLKYTPDKGDPIFLPIANLKTPFSGEFDLSKCGKAGEYLSINTGYRKRRIPENVIKYEIWFTPWFIIEKNSECRVPHLNLIFPSWDPQIAPIGIFWNWGNYDDLNSYMSLTNCDFKAISADNLLTLHDKVIESTATCPHLPRAWLYYIKDFHVYFS